MLHQDKEFSISETVNKNIEKNQFPHFKNHKSLIGWCTMNYPKVLQNPNLIPRPQPRDEEYYERKQDELKYMYQKRTFEMRKGTNFDYKKPFQTFAKHNQAQREEKLGVPPEGFKNSSLSLATVPKHIKKEIINEQNQNLKCASMYPVANEIGKQHYQDDYSRRIRQIGEISYKPKYETEEHRHYKKLPNNVITEQNLIEIMDDNLTYLNLHNHTWIPNELISKIGYFAPNIQELDLSETYITDDILKELSLSCTRLRAINISRCRNLTSEGIENFLVKKQDILTKFGASHNVLQINDEILESLKQSKYLTMIDLSYCKDITDETLGFIAKSGAQLEHINFSSLENIKGDHLAQIIQNSTKTLKTIDLSLCVQKEIGKNICKALSYCSKLEEVNLNGCVNIQDDGIQAFCSNEDPKFKSNGFTELRVFKIAGCESVSETTLLKLFGLAPALQTLDLTHLEKVTDYCLNQVQKSCPKIKTVLINFTPNLEDEVLEQVRQNFPDVNFVRNIVKHTDIKDDGLRMPRVPVSKCKVKPKKKKKR